MRLRRRLPVLLVGVAVAFGAAACAFATGQRATDGPLAGRPAAGMHTPHGGWQCWADAAQRYGVPVDLLYSIARVESGNRSGIVSRPNADGTHDIGLMQINSNHLARLRGMGITEQRLLDEPCLNLNVGAWILARMVSRYGYTWQAIAAYNAGSRMASGRRYALRVYAMYGRIVAEREASATRASKERR